MQEQSSAVMGWSVIGLEAERRELVEINAWRCGPSRYQVLGSRLSLAERRLPPVRRTTICLFIFQPHTFGNRYSEKSLIRALCAHLLVTSSSVLLPRMNRNVGSFSK